MLGKLSLGKLKLELKTETQNQNETFRVMIRARQTSVLPHG